MDLVFEILLWAIITITVFYVLNGPLGIKTAASLFLSFFVSSFMIFFIYQSMFGEIVIMLTIFIGMLYAVFRAIRDRRDDPNTIKPLLQQP
jgi:hypothetical protein